MKNLFLKIAIVVWFFVAVLSLLQSFFPFLSGISICPFRILTGFHCPGCGMGRSLIALFQGNFEASWGYHPLGIPFFSVWTLWIIKKMGFPQINFTLPPPILRGAFTWVILFVVFFIYFVRHII